MQDQAQALPHWVFTVLQNVAWLGAGGLIVKLLTLWQTRALPAVRVQKVEAETTEITIRSKSLAGDSLDRMMARLDRSVAQNEKLRSERDDLQEKCDKLGMEVESYARQMKRMKGFLDSKGLKYSEMDEPK